MIAARPQLAGDVERASDEILHDAAVHADPIVRDERHWHGPRRLAHAGRGVSMLLVADDGPRNDGDEG